MGLFHPENNLGVEVFFIGTVAMVIAVVLFFAWVVLSNRKKTIKTYHVHIDPDAHLGANGTRYTCYAVQNGMFVGSCRGHRFAVQRIHRYLDEYGYKTESGTVDWGTCSKLKLWFYLRWLNLRGYRKDERKW